MSWIDNILVPGQRSKASPALADFNGQLHMVHLGDSSNNIWHSIWLGGNNWSEELIKGQKSKAPPALAAHNGLLHMVHLGDSSNDIWYSKFDGTGWTPNERIRGQKSKASPALAEFNGQLHMVHIGDSSNNIWHSIWLDGNDWTQNIRIEGQQSKAPPAIAAHDGLLHMVHLGDSSNNIWHTTFDGSNWSLNAPIFSQQSKFSPALASFNGRLHMVHLGDSSNRIWYSQFDGSSWTVNVRVPDQLSKASPSIAPFNGRLHMVHLGDTSNNIWHTSSDGRLSILRVGFKFTVPPVTPIDIVLNEARDIFGSVGFLVEEAAPREDLTTPVDLNDLDSGDCVIGENTMEQNELFTHRNNLGPRDIAIYVVNSVLQPEGFLAGCASPGPALPACVIAANADPATMAHEIGHVLGIHHVNDPNNLMWMNTGYTNRPPDLFIDQALTIEASPYSRE